MSFGLLCAYVQEAYFGGYVGGEDAGFGEPELLFSGVEGYVEVASVGGWDGVLGEKAEEWIEYAEEAGVSFKPEASEEIDTHVLG